MAYTCEQARRDPLSRWPVYCAQVAAIDDRLLVLVGTVRLHCR